eukprot:CAMPEP_0183502362 /NCGR_PEP_ID=MMETSP0371-20130417/4183_1 /TAXON_ID=268820 /ORGANISM="Peridinium aciculiferum, Strain PAER-2" /LENGTH=48 /DNA_ID= /DNA_START= /DNA_END= /DNA_ORIENTATION=
MSAFVAQLARAPVAMVVPESLAVPPRLSSAGVASQLTSGFALGTAGVS